MAQTRTVQEMALGLGARAGAAIVALTADGREETTFDALGAEVTRLAAGLAAAGLAPGERAAVLAETRPEWIVAGLAILAAGGVLVPLDTQLAAASLKSVLADSGPLFVFTTAEHAARLTRILPGHAFRLAVLDAPGEAPESWRKLFADGPADLPRLGPDDPAALFYTSGTTGAPKGVPLSQANLSFQIDAVRATGLLGPGDRVLLPLPLHHVYPLVIGMLSPLALGVPLVLPYALTGPELVRALGEGAVGAIIGVPRLYRALYEGIEARIRARGRLAAGLFALLLAASASAYRRLGLRLGRKLFAGLHARFGPNIRMLACGGAPLDPELAWRLEALGWPLAIGYGLTETSPLLAAKLPGDRALDTVGTAFPGVSLRIDPAGLPGGAANEGPTQGEIQARGPGVFAGYRNLPDKTREAFTADGWFRTGDLGFLDTGGRLHVLGRASTLIVTEGGEKVQPEEVEDALAGHPFVREAAVLMREGRIRALIVPETAEIRAKGLTDLREAVAQALSQQAKLLPSYARPADFVLSAEPLERTRLGKLRRHLLPERYKAAAAGARPAAGAGPQAIADMAPEDQALLGEPAALAAWNILAEHFAGAPLTPGASFQLDLNADSLEWMTLGLALHERAGLELTGEDIARLETVRDVLKLAAERSAAGPGAAAPPSDPVLRLSPERRRWLAPLRPFETVLAALAYGLVWIMFHALYRLQVEGRENVPAADPAVVAPNHASYLDPFAVILALGFTRLRTMAVAGWTGAAFVNPVTRLFSRLAQAVPIDPTRGAAESLAYGEALLASNRSLVWFPEGQRSPDGSLLPFRPGLGFILAKQSCPVVPVAIGGTYAAWPVNRRLPRPGRIRVVFGRALTVAELEAAGTGATRAERIVSGLEAAVRRLSPEP